MPLGFLGSLSVVFHNLPQTLREHEDVLLEGR